VTGSLRFINFPFLEQMPIGVLSNQGIEFSSKPILQSHSKDFSKSDLGKNATFKGILEEKTKLMKNDLDEVALDFTESIRAAKHLHDLLSFSEKQSMISLMLIEIGEHMLEFCDFVNQFMRERYYMILVAILERGELDLGQMKFERSVFANKKLLANKKQLAAAYQKFINRTLAHGLHLMHVKGIERYKQSFVCKSITVGFFRVAKFRSTFIATVQMNTDHHAVSQNEIESGSPVQDIDVDDLVRACITKTSANEAV